MDLDETRSAGRSDVARKRTALTKRIEDAEAALLHGYPSLDAAVDAGAIDRALDILELRALRRELWDESASRRAAHNAEQWLADYARRLGEHADRRAGRQAQRKAQFKRRRNLLQPLADQLPRGLTENGAAQRLAAQLALEGTRKAPSERTIRRLLKSGIVTYTK